MAAFNRHAGSQQKNAAKLHSVEVVAKRSINGLGAMTDDKKQFHIAIVGYRTYPWPDLVCAFVDRLDAGCVVVSGGENVSTVSPSRLRRRPDWKP